MSSGYKHFSFGPSAMTTMVVQAGILVQNSCYSMDPALEAALRASTKEVFFRGTVLSTSKNRQKKYINVIKAVYLYGLAKCLIISNQWETKY